ncbi:MAG: 2-phospho-L-lactate transferase [Woeseiaceae bacterium]
MTSTVVALSGGVGGAKLAFGLSKVLADGELTVVANTGDDFEHLGLHVSPDIDTLVYTLAGVNNAHTGWGRAGETWSFMSALEEIGAPTWFQLGDKDLAMNVFRSDQLRSGACLSDTVAAIVQRFGIRCRVVPMSDDTVRTMLDTDSGTLAFQEYFVHQKCEPAVTRIWCDGIDGAKASAGFSAALASERTEAFIICPSNPYLSIDPAINLPGVRKKMAAHVAPVIAVSPLVAGDSLKGPTSKIMRELGLPCNAVEVASHYRGLIDGIVIDRQDEHLGADIERLGIRLATANIVMNSAEEKIGLAESVLEFTRELAQP